MAPQPLAGATWLANSYVWYTSNIASECYILQSGPLLHKGKRYQSKNGATSSLRAVVQAASIPPGPVDPTIRDMVRQRRRLELQYPQLGRGRARLHGYSPCIALVSMGTRPGWRFLSASRPHRMASNADD